MITMFSTETVSPISFVIAATLNENFQTILSLLRKKKKKRKKEDKMLFLIT